jgi:hypothetical protein
MFKTLISVLVFGLATLATAHEIDIFSPKNFLKATTPANLMKELVNLASGRIVKDGTVKFGACAAAVAGDFLDDPSSTYAQPATVTKGISVGFNLGGLLKQATTITNIDINVLWNNTPLHKEDHPMTKVIAANGPFTYNLSWAIPAFAPSGHYKVTITVDGKVAGATAAQSVGCVTADFDL